MEVALVYGAIVVLLVDVSSVSIADVSAVFELHLSVIGPVVLLFIVHAPKAAYLRLLRKVIPIFYLSYLSHTLDSEFILELKLTRFEHVSEIKLTGLQPAEEFVTALFGLEDFDVWPIKEPFYNFKFVLSVRLEQLFANAPVLELQL